MQNSEQKFQFSYSLILFALISIGCSKTASFDEAIREHKSSSLTLIPKVGEGLPYYSPESLTPTWSAKNIVSLPDLDLIDQSGRSVNRGTFKGKVSVISFIFTSCAGFCPLLIGKLKKIEAKIGTNPNVQLVAITVDPEVDTPERLLQFGKDQGVTFSDRWIFVTGTKERILGLVRDTFSSEVKRLPDENLRKFAHSEHFYILDQELRLRSILNGTRIDLPDSAFKVVRLLSGQAP